RLVARKVMPMPWWNGGPCVRSGSPSPGSSTLTTSAPRSASSIEQYGPAKTRVKSITFKPASGLSFGVFIAASVHRDLGGASDLAPLGGFAGDVLRKLLGCAVHDLGAGLGESLLHLGKLEDSDD